MQTTSTFLLPPTHNPSIFPPYSHFRGKHASCGAVTEEDWLHNGSTISVPFANVWPSHTAAPGLLLLYPARHTQQHRIFCFTPPVTHSKTGSSALPRQSHTAKPGLLLYPASHTQQHRIFCFTPPGTHSNTGSSALPRQSQAGSGTTVGRMCLLVSQQLHFTVQKKSDQNHQNTVRATTSMCVHRRSDKKQGRKYSLHFLDFPLALKLVPGHRHE